MGAVSFREQARAREGAERLWGWLPDTGQLNRNPREVKACAMHASGKRVPERGNSKVKGPKGEKRGKVRGERGGISWDKPCGVRTLQRDNALH